VREGSAQALSGAAGHRHRLTVAMADAASKYGYSGATVSRVVEAAGVSRATFYEHFTGRDDSFLAAYREKSRQVGAVVEAATQAAAQEDRPAAVLDILLEEVATDPAAVRLVLIEALAAPAPIRTEHEQLIARVEEVVARYLDGQESQCPIQIPAMALVAGVGEVVAMRALGGAKEDSATLRSALLRWIDSYRLPPGARPLPQGGWQELGRFAKSIVPPAREEPPLLPRGRSALTPVCAAAVRRRRLLDATARLSVSDGYFGLTVARIAAAARVPRAAFYSHFDCKEDALLAAQTEALQEGMGAAAAAYSPAAPWPERVWKAGEALLSNVARNRDYAHLDFVESYAAGPVAIRRRHQNHMAFAMFIEDGYRHTSAAPLSPVAPEAIAGAIFGLMRSLVVAGRTDRMLSLLPVATYTILTPFIGPKVAADQVKVWAREAY